MPNKALQAKAEKHARQVKEFAEYEGRKSFYTEHAMKSKAERRAETRAMIEASDVKVRRFMPAEAKGLRRDIGREGKGGRVRQTTCYGDGTRKFGDWRNHYVVK